MLPRAEQKQQTRNALMDAARHLMECGRGFGSLSLREVAKAAGIVPTGFYRHFSDMDQLGLELVSEVGQTFRETIRLVRHNEFLNRWLTPFFRGVAKLVERLDNKRAWLKHPIQLAAALQAVRFYRRMHQKHGIGTLNVFHSRQHVGAEWAAYLIRAVVAVHQLGAILEKPHVPIAEFDESEESEEDALARAIAEEQELDA